MLPAATERLHDMAKGLDARPPVDVARVLCDAQIDALTAVRAALAQIVAASDLVVECLRGPGCLVYAGAGSSGLMAAADAMELPGTYGIAPERIRIEMAGGLPTAADLPGGVEDDAPDGTRRGRGLKAGDAAIVVAASGRTPYAVAFAEAARKAGARTICIANNPDVPLFDHADVAVLLATPPEPIAGSTRMGAGTAQKAALNILSTLTGVALGHVHDGMMVNLRADNAKLHARAARMVAAIAGVDASAADAALSAAGGDVRRAVLLTAGVENADAAGSLLETTRGNLRAALARLKPTA